MASLEKNFVNLARQQVKFGPSSVGDFTKWRVKSVPPPGSCSSSAGWSSTNSLILILSFWSQVEVLAKEHLQALTEPAEEPEQPETTHVHVRRFESPKVHDVVHVCSGWMFGDFPDCINTQEEAAAVAEQQRKSESSQEAEDGAGWRRQRQTGPPPQTPGSHPDQRGPDESP